MLVSILPSQRGRVITIGPNRQSAGNLEGNTSGTLGWLLAVASHFRGEREGLCMHIAVFPAAQEAAKEKNDKGARINGKATPRTSMEAYVIHCLA